MKYLKKNLILEFLILLLPISLITGPFIPELILLFSIFIFLLLIYEEKDFQFLFNDFTKIFFIFYLFIVIRSIFVDESLISLKNSLFYFRFLFLALIIKYLILNNNKFINKFVITFITVLFLVSVDAIIEYYIGSHWLFDKSLYAEDDNNRISGLFDDEYILGGFVLVFFPSIMLLFYERIKLRKKFKIIISLVILIIFIFTIIISGERSSLAKLFLLLTTIIIFTSVFGNLKIRISILVLIFFSLSLFIISQPKLNERLIYHTLDLILQNKSNSKIDRNLSIYEYFRSSNIKDLNFTYYSNEHRDHAIISINMFKDKFILGHGVKMFRFKCSDKKYYINERSCSTHSHSIFFTFISELGSVGTIFLIVIYYKLIKSIFLSKKNFDKVILLTLIIYLFPFIPSGYFFNNFFSLVLYTLVGIYFGMKKLRLTNV